MAELDLEDLLRKCHRAELLPLASRLRIRPAGMGRDALAHHIANTLRRRGGNGITNIVQRRGAGPPYSELLDDLLRRCNVAASGGLEDRELALVRWGLARSWGSLEDADRDALWSRLDQVPPVPADGEAVPTVSESNLKARFGYVAAAAAVTVVTRVGPVSGCATVWWLAKPDDRLVLPAVLAVARLRQSVCHRVTVGVVGSPSSGKDAAVNAIFGLDSGNVDPVAGSTKTVEITRLPDATALYVVNTPGLGDVVASVTEEARQILDHIDVYLYLVNAQGGVQAREKADWETVRATGRPALAVVNKVDTIRDTDRDRYLTDAAEKLQVAPENFRAAAFDPLPQLADAPIGVDEIRTWIADQLVALGKDPAELPWNQDTA